MAVIPRPDAGSSVRALQDELLRLDDAWEARQESFMVLGRYGLHVATVADTILRAFFSVFVAYAFFHEVRSMSEVLSPVGMLGVLVFGVCLVGTVRTDLKARGHARAEAAMEHERARLLARLEAATQRAARARLPARTARAAPRRRSWAVG